MSAPSEAVPVSVGTLIALEAVHALGDPDFTGKPGECQKFVREVCEAAGEEARRVMDTFRRATARETMEAFRGTRYVVWVTGQGPHAFQDGDLIYKGSQTSGPDGHAAIAVNGRHVGLAGTVLAVCENSHYQLNNPVHRVQGAKGWREISRFGPYEMVVRL